MPEFYEPHPDFTVPEHQNILGVILSLRDPVDGEILRWAVEESRKRFPYFYVKAAYRGDALVTMPNDRLMTVRNTWEPIRLHSASSNCHLAAWKYETRRLAFEIHHALTDGSGVLPYVMGTMFLYLSKVTGRVFDPAGFCLPGDMIPASETGNPFSGLDIDSVEAPLYKKKTIPDFFRLSDGTEDSKTVFYVKLSETQVMQYCISYVNSKSFGPPDPYIEEQHAVTSLSKITDILCEISCLNRSFFLAFMQPYSSDRYFRCFLDELDLAGIGYEILGSEPLRMCWI